MASNGRVGLRTAVSKLVVPGRTVGLCESNPFPLPSVEVKTTYVGTYRYAYCFSKHEHMFTVLRL